MNASNCLTLLAFPSQTLKMVVVAIVYSKLTTHLMRKLEFKGVMESCRGVQRVLIRESSKEKPSNVIPTIVGYPGFNSKLHLTADIKLV